MPVESRGKPGRMPRLAPPFPNLKELTAGLQLLLGRRRSRGGAVRVLIRKPGLVAGTYPSEVVTCCLADGSKRRLLCKYEAGVDHSAHGHRGGVAYEARVYRRVLGPLRISAPKFYGACRDGRAGTWLVLEYVGQSERVDLAGAPDALAQAARWIGQFHAVNEARLARAPLPFLKTYDERYYLDWVRRSSAFAERWQVRFPWFATLCERFERLAASLWCGPITVIHGEYYPLNILLRRGTIVPVDWESAAVGAGEIDLAALTEDWPAATVGKCEREYQRARWADRPPPDFRQRLAIARLYLRFRWMGEHPRWAARQSTALWCFKQLRSTGKRCGLI